MSPDFFDALEHDLRDVVNRQVHVPAWRRVWLRRSRALITTLAVLVVAAPAVAAVTGLLSQGAPNRFGHVSAGDSIGHAIPRSGELLSLRIPDPDGGLPWGLRLIRTTRGYSCLQFGRVQDGQLGSLGIDHHWNDDDRFHPLLPDNYLDAECGVTDPRGEGFLADSTTAERSAGTTYGARGPAASTCVPAGSGVPLRGPTGQVRPMCPRGSSRLIYLGLLGPDASAITYTTPAGTSATERTVGRDGAYLLVFRRDGETCDRYDPSGDHPALGGMSISRSACPEGQSSSPGGVSLPSAITAIHYRTGTVCHLRAAAGFDAAYIGLFDAEQAARNRLLRSVTGTHGGVSSAADRADLQAVDRRLEARYMSGYPRPGTAAYANDVDPTCPWVGLVEPRTRKLSDSQVKAPVTIQVSTSGRYCTIHGADEWDTLAPCGPGKETDPVRLGKGTFALVDIDFTAREGVRNARSWYEFSVTPERTGGVCVNGGGSSGASFWDIRAGQREVWQDWYPLNCPGVYRGVISYQPNGKLANTESGGGGLPGRDGSLIVGVFSFRIP